MNGVVTALTEAGHRLTGPRKTVASLIDGRDGHFTAADLIEDAQRKRLRLGRATVFRSLELLTSLEVLERLDLPTGDHAYVACAPEQHHHHVVCRTCGRSDEVGDSGLEAVVRDIAQRTGYRIDTHRLELFGLCPDHRGAL